MGVPPLCGSTKLKGENCDSFLVYCSVCVMWLRARKGRVEVVSINANARHMDFENSQLGASEEEVCTAQGPHRWVVSR
jgi:hypothetical protein